MSFASVDTSFDAKHATGMAQRNAAGDCVSGPALVGTVELNPGDAASGDWRSLRGRLVVSVLSRQTISRSAQATRQLSDPAHLGRGFSACDELTQERKEEGFAEAPDRRLGFEIKRLADDIGIVFIEDDPKTQIGIESGPPFLDCRYLSDKAPCFGLLGRNGEEQHHVTIGPDKPYADSDRSLLSSFGLALGGLSCPEIGVTDDCRRLDVVIAAHRPASSFSAY